MTRFQIAGGLSAHDAHVIVFSAVGPSWFRRWMLDDILRAEIEAWRTGTPFPAWEGTLVRRGIDYVAKVEPRAAT